jgi:hypothetical protein
MTYIPAYEWWITLPEGSRETGLRAFSFITETDDIEKARRISLQKAAELEPDRDCLIWEKANITRGKTGLQERP